MHTADNSENAHINYLYLDLDREAEWLSDSSTGFEICLSQV